MRSLVAPEFRPECVDDGVLEAFTRTCFPDTPGVAWPTIAHVEELNHCSADVLVCMCILADFLDMPIQFTQLLHHIKARLALYAHTTHQSRRHANARQDNYMAIKT